jgi:site-specific recombinase XerD
MKSRHKRNKIYSTDHLFIYPTKSDSFSIEGVIQGKRIRLRYRSLQEAKYKCHDLEEGINDLGIARTNLVKAQLRDAEEAFDLLPEGASLKEAVRLYLKANMPSRVSVKGAVWKFLATKESCSKNTYDQAKVLLLKLVDWADGRTLDSISREDAQNYLKTARSGSYNHYLRFAKSLYKWAISEELTNNNPFKNIAPKTRILTEVSVLSCDEVKALLRASEALHEGELLPYAAITLFAGLRPDSEMRQLSWDAINLEDAEIRVTMGKTRIPRTVDIPDNLVKWLKKCEQSRPIYPKNFRRKWAKIRNKAGFKGGAAKTTKEKTVEIGLKPWVKDYTRHTAISYRVRQTGDIHSAATWAGNSPNIIKSYYLGLVSRSESSKFWANEP